MDVGDSVLTLQRILRGVLLRKKITQAKKLFLKLANEVEDVDIALDGEWSRDGILRLPAAFRLKTAMQKPMFHSQARKSHTEACVQMPRSVHRDDACTQTTGFEVNISTNESSQSHACQKRVESPLPSPSQSNVPEVPQTCDQRVSHITEPHSQLCSESRSSSAEIQLCARLPPLKDDFNADALAASIGDMHTLPGNQSVLAASSLQHLGEPWAHESLPAYTEGELLQNTSPHHETSQVEITQSLISADDSIHRTTRVENMQRPGSPNLHRLSGPRMSTPLDNCTLKSMPHSPAPDSMQKMTIPPLTSGLDSDRTSIWSTTVHSSILDEDEPVRPSHADLSSLNEQRENISLELLWVQQAISSRKQYLALKNKLKAELL